MKNIKISIFTISTFVICFFSSIVSSHPGGLDSNGGHYNKKMGEYHCHREPCFSNINKAPYVRDEWVHWTNKDNDCQNTRTEVLIETSIKPVTFTSSKACTVKGGEWKDPYTGQLFQKASDVEIDHVVPLKWAHDHGAANWPSEKKEQFANDVENLIPVSSSINQEKGAKAPGEWMPPNQSYHCEYLEIWVKVILQYDLSLSQYESGQLSEPLESCNIAFGRT